MRGPGGIQDGALSLKYGYDRKYANEMEGLTGAAGVNTSLGVGGQQAEVSPNTAELSAVTMATGDEVYFLLNPRKWDWDLSRDLQVLVGFQLTTGSDTGVIWTLDMKAVGPGQALSDAKVTPDATKIFPAVSGVTFGSVNDGICETVWASMGSAGLFLPTDSLIQCAVTLTNSGDAAADEIRLLYVDFRYTLSLTDENGPYRT